jgi:hypothetical protein
VVLNLVHKMLIMTECRIFVLTRKCPRSSDRLARPGVGVEILASGRDCNDWRVRANLSLNFA